jgi:hypothetical protein
MLRSDLYNPANSGRISNPLGQAAGQVAVVDEVKRLGAPCPCFMDMELRFVGRSIAVPPLECADHPEWVDASVCSGVHAAVSPLLWREGPGDSAAKKCDSRNQRG